MQHHSHLQTQVDDPQEYSIETAKVIAKVINELNHQFAQTYSLKKGIKELCERCHKAAHKEMKQLHGRVVFIPILIEELTHVKQKQAMESLIFLTEKKDGKIKARTCANGNTQQEYTDRDKAASPRAWLNHIS
jgi:transcriptional regulator